MNCDHQTRNMLSLSMLAVDAFLQRAQFQVVSNKNAHGLIQIIVVMKKGCYSDKLSLCLKFNGWTN